MGRSTRYLEFVLGIIIIMVGVCQLILLPPRSAQAATIPGTPSATPVGLFGFYLNTGFSLQPDDRYTYLGSPEDKVLTTDTAHSMWAIITGITASDHFKWYQSTGDGKSWQAVKNGNKADLVIASDKEGITYYQQSFQYYTIFPIPFVTATYYSRIAKVTTLPTPVDATDLTVTSDNDYLYNNQKTAATTYVHGTPTPANATGNLSWTSSDESLATVDAATGKVTANTVGKSGKVTVTGTLKNHGQADATASTTIAVGGGLADQTVEEPQPATFTVSGAGQWVPDTVTWHKVTPNGTDTVVAKNQSLTYTTPATTQADNQSQFYAEIKMTMFDEQEKPQTQTITTGRAKLTVTPSRAPQVTVKSQVKNLTDGTGDTDTSLSNVIPGDQCEISGTIMDLNVNSKLTDGDFVVRLPGSAQVSGIQIDGETAQVDRQPTVDETEVDLTVKGLKFANILLHTFTVDFTSQQTALMDYMTHVQLVGRDAAKQPLGTYQGDPLTLKFTDGNLHATAQPVNFGTIGPAEFGKDVSAQGMGNLLDVVDYRRQKSATQVALQQVTAFQNGNRQLAASLHFDDDQGERLLLGPAAQAVTTIADGQTVLPLGPKYRKQLTLQLAPAVIHPGPYTATLQWTFISAPQG